MSRTGPSRQERWEKSQVPSVHRTLRPEAGAVAGTAQHLGPVSELRGAGG